MMKAVTIHCAVILILALTGCARQPATTGTSAPAPGGAAGTTAAGGGSDRSTSATAGDAGRGAGSAGAFTSGDRPPVHDFRVVAELADVHFDYDTAEIRETDAGILDANAAWLKSNKDHLVLVEGHCDERGTSEYNAALGDRRARATKNYLVSRGVAASRISVISYGEERPACAQRAADCWARNRRAHFLVKPR